MLYYKEVIIIIAITLQNRTSLFLPFSCLSSLQTLNKTFVLYRTHHGRMSFVYCHIELSFLIFCSSEQSLINVHQQEKKGLVYIYLYIIANDLRQASWCFRFDKKKNPSLSRHFAINGSSLLYACLDSRSSCRTDQRQPPPGINDRCSSLDKVYSYSRYVTYHGFLQLRVTLY